MESPPQDDTCSICLGSFTHPCQANCSHWFCGECILSVWHHGSIFQQCKCPICRCFINLLKPTDASVQEGKDRKANQVLKTIKKYNRSFGGEPSNLMQKLQNLPFFIRRLAMVLMDPRRPLPSLFRAHITFALSLSAMYVLSPVDLLPEDVYGVVGLLDDLLVLLPNLQVIFINRQKMLFIVALVISILQYLHMLLFHVKRSTCYYNHMLHFFMPLHVKSDFLVCHSACLMRDCT
nr:PREDICTED: E3 ubiquitin-protein ligase RNF170-like isoform X2 [Musa acuminata subsp. malaccensis]